MHPLLTKHPRLLGFADFISKWVLVAGALVGVAEVIEYWKILDSPTKFLTAFNLKNGQATNHISSIVSLSILCAVLVFYGGLSYKNSLKSACWVGLVIALHETLWWITNWFFISSEYVHVSIPSITTYIYYAASNYPSFFLVIYVVIFGWGKRETILLGAVACLYIFWAYMGFHVTSDVPLGWTIWRSNLQTNLIESGGWLYCAVIAALCYLLHRR